VLEGEDRSFFEEEEEGELDGFNGVESDDNIGMILD